MYICTALKEVVSEATFDTYRLKLESRDWLVPAYVRICVHVYIH